MTKLTLHYWYWLLTRFFKKIDFSGLFGLAITLGCCLFYVMMILPLKEQINLTQQQLENIKPEEIILQSTSGASAENMAHEVAAFKQLLPQSNTLHQWLGLIDKTALKQRLVLNHGDYKLTQTKQGELSRYEIVLPVAGQYTQIRQFIANVLQLQPALALSNVKIQRDSVLSPTVEAKLVFVLFLQGGSL